MKKKNVTIDLRTAHLFGPSCKCLEPLEDFRSRGYTVNLIAKPWEKDCKESGVTYDEKSKKFKPGNSRFLWDPKLHPVDFYENLVVPTFSNINYLHTPPPTNFFARCIRRAKELFSPRYFSYLQCCAKFMEPLELKRYHQQQKDHLSNEKTPKGYLKHFYTLLNLKFFRHLKVKYASKGFRYKLKATLLDENVVAIIQEAKRKKIPHILISANWDDDKKFEKLDDRLRGILYEEEEFNSMVNYVKKLDKLALQGKLRLVLASKKAADWDKILKSDFLDLRAFEKKELTLSQTLFIIQEISQMTINWPSTFAIWITHCSDILHLTWNDNKDTAKWARNTLHKEPVEKALALIGLKPPF